MQKRVFLVSDHQRQLSVDESYSALDSYIGVNNPDYNIETYPPLRTCVDDWKTYIGTVDQKYEKYLVVLSKRLNALHGVTREQSYWKQLFYLGLKGYITRVFEFYMQASTRFCPEKHKVEILDQHAFYTPFDLQELNNYLSNSELAQEQLFAIYIQTFYEKLEPAVFTTNNNFGDIKQTTRLSFRYKIALFFFQLLRFNNPSVLFIGTNYDKKYILKLLAKSRFKIFWLDFLPFKRSKNIEKRYEHRDFIAQNDETFDAFDKFFFNTLRYVFPTIFLEEYQNASTYYENVCDRYKDIKHVISESWIADNQMSFFIAHLRLRDVAFICSEHKGLQHPFIGNSIHDLTGLVDKYYTSGWYSKHYDEYDNLVQTGLLHKIKGSKDIPVLKNKILYLTAPAFAKKYTYNCNASFMGEDGFEHFLLQKSFFSSLSKDVLQALVYRIAPRYRSKSIIMYDQEMILEEYLQFATIDMGEYSGIDSMHNAKLVVIDYLNSGYLESLLNNYPTLLFLNTNDYLDESQLHIFDELIEAKIVHRSGESAGKFLMEIYENPKDWWMSEKVQEARLKFLEAQVGQPEVLLEKIFTLLK